MNRELLVKQSLKTKDNEKQKIKYYFDNSDNTIADSARCDAVNQ